jgi:SAM-dependent methyltransferase
VATAAQVTADRQRESSTILSCPICESRRRDDYIVIGYGSQPNGVQNFPVLRCRRQAVEFADALPVPQSDSGAKESLDHCYGSPFESHPRYVDFMDRVEAVVGRKPDALLHDIGCGNGQLLFEARRRGWRVQGNDIVPGVREGIEQAGIPCKIGSLSDLNLEPEACEVVTSFCVLPQHLTNPTPDMLAVARMLKSGGWFVLQLPDNGLFRRVGRMCSRLFWPGRPSPFARFVMANLYGPGGHQFAYTRANLKQYLRKCGFAEVIFQSYFPSSRYALARFHSRPIWHRIAATIAVNGMRWASQILCLPNHVIAYAKKQ